MKRITLGQKVRQARLTKKMTQKEVAGDFITRNMLSKIENDSAMPSVKTVDYLSKVLNKSTGYFLSSMVSSSNGQGNIFTEDDNAILNKVKIWYKEGKYHRIIEYINKSIQDLTENIYGYDEICLLLSRCYTKLAELENSLGEYQRSIAYSKKAILHSRRGIYSDKSNNLKLQVLISEGKMMTDDMSWKEDLDIIKRDILYSDEYLSYKLLYADKHLDDWNCEEIICLLDDIDKQTTDSIIINGRLNYLRGRCHIKMSEYKKAMECFDLALTIMDGNKTMSIKLLVLMEGCAVAAEDYKLAHSLSVRQIDILKKQ